MKYLVLIVIVVAGAGIPIQVAANKQLDDGVKSPALSSALAFFIGAIALLALTATGWMGRGHLSGAASAPWWAWMGGLLSAFVVVASVLGLKAGAGAVIAATVFGQLMAAIVIDHFGWLGVPRIPVNAWRVLGAVLLLGGAVLISHK